MSAVLEIKNLIAGTSEDTILDGVSLRIGAGEVHAIMGPNGSGKSTLAHVLAGEPSYEVRSGQVLYEGADLLALEPHERARLGVFLAFQHPVEIPGVSNLEFLKTALDSQRNSRDEAAMSATDFMQLVRRLADEIGLAPEFLRRSVNEDFSGGEKKRNEVMQMLLLEPRLCVLDELDSGLDIDALQVLAAAITKMRNKERSFLLITHYQRLLNFIQPDFVHALSEGRIVRTGGPELAHELEKKGYGWLVEDDEGDGGAEAVRAKL